MTSYTISLASPDSMDAPLLNLNRNEVLDANPAASRFSSSNKTAVCLLTILTLTLCGGFLITSRNPGQNEPLFEQQELSPEAYGVDISWPIHGPIAGSRFSHSGADGPFAKGSRHEAYLQHLERCRQFYGKRSRAAARTCDAYEYDRLLMNKRQPQSMENYTDTGFKQIRAPPRIARIVQSFWERNKDRQGPEMWPEGNIYLNHWDSPSRMVSVDDTGLRGSGYALKSAIWNEAKTTISQWTGGQDLTPVSQYGIRVYTNGSMLIPHVDRLPLVASAMICVAQDLEEPWPLELYDHDGRAHNVTLEPGDMLLFESHSVIHGRPFAMKGNYAAFLFVHFEPTGATPLRNKESVDEQYRQSVQDGVGGQSSSEQNSLLPPYIRRFSPEEEHWQREHPNGWKIPAAAPASYTANNNRADNSDASDINNDANEKKLRDDSTKKSKSSPPSQPAGHQAARDGNVEFWKAALAATGDNNDTIYKLVNRRDQYGWQPIHESAVNGKEEMIDFLLEHGANINSRTNGGRGGTPLFLAQQQLGADHSIVHFLVNRGALNIPPENFRDEL